MTKDAKSFIYYFEHRLLPEVFYGAKGGFIMAINKDLQELNRVFHKSASDAEVEEEVPEDFMHTELVYVDDDKKDYLQIVEFNGPEECPLCKIAVMRFDKDFTKLMYYTFEYEFDGSAPVLCGWDEEGNHLNFGDKAETVPEMLEIIASKIEKEKTYA